jgi:F0F1-type ATP synthase membrane subunit b/b'
MVTKDRMLAAEVRGLKELQRELRAADPELARQLQQVHKRLVEGVADEARSAAGASVSTRSRRLFARRPRDGRRA